MVVVSIVHLAIYSLNFLVDIDIVCFFVLFSFLGEIPQEPKTFESELQNGMQLN